MRNIFSRPASHRSAPRAGTAHPWGRCGVRALMPSVVCAWRPPALRGARPAYEFPRL